MRIHLPARSGPGRLIGLAAATILAASALAGCNKAKPLLSDANAPPAAPTETPDAKGGCDVKFETPWTAKTGGPTDNRSFAIEASTFGPRCESAAVLLVIRGLDAYPVYTWSGVTAQVFGLADAHEAGAMKTALKAWTDQASTQYATTGDLPVWEETSGQSKQTDFPFMPGDGMNREAWDELRKGKHDVFCFPQGMESLQCLALRESQLEPIGLQLFPG